MFDKDNKFGFIINNNNNNEFNNSDIKKYIDDKITVKILPVDVDKNYATNVADLEPHSIYMSPNDAKFLYLGYEKLNGSFSGFYITSKPHGKFIYTGAKDDTKIEIMIEGICYTAYFKTDTVDAHTEKTVFYLTKNNNKEFTPTYDYEPATKKYVDDNKEYINYNDKQINNKITALHISRNPVSCSTEINKKPLCELFPELLNMTYNVVFKKSISFKVNMDNFIKDYPTVKSAYNKIGINLYDENDNYIGNSYGSYINGDGLNIVYINTTQSIRFSAYFDKALVDGSNTSMETKNGYMTIQFSIPKGDNKKEFIDKIKNLKLSIIVFKTDFLNLNNESIYTPTTDYNPATKKYVDDSIPIRSFPVNDTTRTGAVVDVNNLTVSGRYVLPKRTDGKQWTNLMMRAMINDGSDKGKSALLSGYQNYVFYVNIENKKIYCDNLRIVYSIGTTADTTDIRTEPYYLTTTNTKEYTPTKEYHPATKKYVDDNKIAYTISSKVLTTVSASNIKLNNEITVNNITLNKDRKYYIEFLGSKKLCNLMMSKDSYSEIFCAIGNYVIQGMISSSNLMLGIHKMSPDDTTVDTFTDLVIYEEEIKCLDNKYLENDLRVQNSISLGRVGDIGTESSAVGMEVQASGMAAHAEGYGVRAAGNFSHAEGSFTKALNEDSHAEGYSTIASSDYQHVQGKNNIEDKDNKYAHIVGNGFDLNTRSNAHTLDWEGNAWYSGKLSQEGTPTEDKDLTTKKYVDDKVSSLPQFSFNENGELVVKIGDTTKIFVPKE